VHDEKVGNDMSAIKSQLVKGAKWTGLSTGLITIVQLVQFIVLGNTMSISDFGLVGIMTTIIMFAHIILDLGFSSAVIQKEAVSHRQLSTLFWLNVLVGLSIFVVMNLASPLLAGFFHRSELEQLLSILAYMFLLAPIGQQSQYLLQKELRFSLLGMIEVISTIISFLTLMILIFTISPIYAYVISQVILYSLKSILYLMFYQKSWRPSFTFHLSECKDLLSFGSFQLASRLVNRLGSNIDVILIGRFMGAEALGIYHLVYQIVTIPVLKINPILTRVAFPVFSKNQHNNKALHEGFLHMTKLLSLVTFPMLMMLTALSNVFILTFFGQKWIDAVVILQIMAFVGILRVLMNPNGSIILAKGKANLAFYWDACVLLLYGISLYLAVLTNELQVVAWTYVAVSMVNFLLGRWLLSFLIQLNWRHYLGTISIPFLLSLSITVIAYVIKESCEAFFPQNHIYPLVISVGGSMALYVLLLYKAYPSAFFVLAEKRSRGR